LTVHAPGFHPKRHHPPRPSDDHGGFVGVDRGLAAFAVAATADGTEVGRFRAPKPLQRDLVGLRRRSRAASRAQPGSRHRAKAVRRLSRQHDRIANSRRSFLHEVSSQLATTHDRLCLEDLAVANLMGNRRLARAIGDAGWTQLARQLTYKAAWFGAELVVCDRWFPSTRTCSRCGLLKERLRLAERGLSLRPLWPGDGPGPQRRRQPRRLGRAVPRPGPRPPSGRPGDQRPWRGRRWPSRWRWRNRPR
ncbi:MAG TPA: RNA-guided endonuclease TnpB family protein, partial [Actinomycetes bacterium]|nr:RNA-guided endonuclease TnpB family protein [Actinomycetes bacterium]